MYLFHYDIALHMNKFAVAVSYLHVTAILIVCMLIPLCMKIPLEILLDKQHLLIECYTCMQVAGGGHGW